MKRNGFTLIELLVSLPIGAALLLVVVSSYYQIVQGRVDIAQKTIAINDIDLAFHSLAGDLLMAQQTDLIEDGDPVPYMTLEWSDLTHWGADAGTIEHAVSYYIADGKLYRNYDGQLTIVARYLTYAGFSISDYMFTVTLTSRPGLPESAVTRTIKSEMRTDELPSE
jgi:prepilin-type N-terminal cleavage/methylation domain-containing protein